MIGNTYTETPDAFKILDLRIKWLDEQRKEMSVTAVYRLRDRIEDLEITEVGANEMGLVSAIQQKLFENYGTRKSLDEQSDSGILQEK